MHHAALFDALLARRLAAKRAGEGAAGDAETERLVAVAEAGCGRLEALAGAEGDERDYLDAAREHLSNASRYRAVASVIAQMKGKHGGDWHDEARRSVVEALETLARAAARREAAGRAKRGLDGEGGEGEAGSEKRARPE